MFAGVDLFAGIPVNDYVAALAWYHVAAPHYHHGAVQNTPQDPKLAFQRSGEILARFLAYHV